MKRGKIVVPIRKKLPGAPKGNKNGAASMSLRTTQFAIEQAVKRIVALEKQADGLARLDKQREIQANADRLRIRTLEGIAAAATSALKRIEGRMYREDSE